jgi:DNA polymerase-3 subunit gamma/tau
VGREDAAAVFDLAGRAVESGYDLRLVIRELARLTRDVLVVSLDRTRLDDPEIAAESERDRLAALAGTFSPEDLMRAFDVLTKAEADIKAAAQPRHHVEMALLRWIHLRRLVPLSDLIDGLEKGAPPSSATPGSAPPRPAMKSPAAASASVRAVQSRRQEPAAAPAAAPAPAATAKPVGQDGLKTAFLDEIQKGKKFFYGTVVAQAQKIDVEPGRIVFTFSPQHKPLRLQLETMRGWLEELASRLAGTKVAVEGVEGASGGGAGSGQPAGPDPRDAKQAELKKQAMAEPGVQAMLDVFAADIKEVEEM